MWRRGIGLRCLLEALIDLVDFRSMDGASIDRLRARARQLSSERARWCCGWWFRSIRFFGGVGGDGRLARSGLLIRGTWIGSQCDCVRLLIPCGSCSLQPYWCIDDGNGTLRRCFIPCQRGRVHSTNSKGTSHMKLQCHPFSLFTFFVFTLLSA